MTNEPDASIDPDVDLDINPDKDPDVDPATDEHARNARSPRPRWLGSTGVAIVLAIAGLLFATSASTSRGTQLRSERANLADLVSAETLRVQTRSQRVAALRDQVKAETATNAVGNDAVRSLDDEAAPLEIVSGLTPVAGPGLIVTLNDAPRDAAVPAQAGPDDLVVHQQDVQAVVNALWAGGAEAMMLQDQRVISTSAVRCVGNTLILQGRVYSPPYVITAIGNVAQMRGALNSSPEISYYLEYVAALQLGWKIDERPRLTFPAFAGSLGLQHATTADSKPTTSPIEPFGASSSSSNSTSRSSATTTGSTG